MVNFIEPKYLEKAFHCPHCKTYANQHWETSTFSAQYDDNLCRARCVFCKLCSYWYEKKMIIPDGRGFPPPSLDLEESIVKDYREASSIVNKSPRGAAALMRLCIQKLCIQLGERGKNINNDIGELVKKGLSVKTQKMLDIVRVIGNNAVHPGTLDLDDTPEIVIALAKLTNEIVYEMITKPRELDELYNSLPESARIAIENRDNPKTSGRS